MSSPEGKTIVSRHGARTGAAPAPAQSRTDGKNQLVDETIFFFTHT
jgi:hypothetical protein